MLFGEGQLTINGITRSWQGLIGRGVEEAHVTKSHCDQCGEYIDRRVGHGDGHWVHEATGSQYCVQGTVNGQVVSWSAEPCEPCAIEGCLGNEEWEETHP